MVFHPSFKRKKTVAVRRRGQYRQHNRAGVREGEEDVRAADVVEAHDSAPPDKGATVAGGDDNAPVESLVVATVGDTLAGGEVFVGDVAAATR